MRSADDGRDIEFSAWAEEANERLVDRLNVTSRDVGDEFRDSARRLKSDTRPFCEHGFRDLFPDDGPFGLETARGLDADFNRASDCLADDRFPDGHLNSDCTFS